jgi:hypothetical protein
MTRTTAINLQRLYGRLGRAAALGLLALAATLAQSREARAQWTTSGANTTTTNNVGVNTGAPSATLEVVGAPGAANNTNATAPDALKVTGGTGGNGNWSGGPGGVGGSLTFAGGTGGAPASGSQSAIGGKGGSINLSGGAGGANTFNVGGGAGGDVVINGGAGVANSNGNVILGNLRGNVGVGTAAPTGRLHVAGDNTAAGGYPLLKLQNTQAGGHSWWLYSGANNVAGSFGIFDETANAYRLFASANGNIGLGTTSPGSKLHIVSGTDAAVGMLHLDTGVHGGASFGVYGTTNNESGFGISVYRAGQYFDRMGVTNYGHVYLEPNASAYGNVGIGTTTPATKLHVVGDVTVTGNINAKWQDVAEWVPSTQKLQAGTVVVLDTRNSNHVLASTTSYDARVAGVVSAQPGLTLGEAGEGKALVATTGRVKVKVDATRAPVRIGDLLVTSDVAGVAMKSEPINIAGRQIHAPGTIIGKALEPLEKGAGEILVLLSLQ